jgi:hypothetical protein
LEMIGEEKSKTHFLLYFPISLSVVLTGLLMYRYSGAS